MPLGDFAAEDRGEFCGLSDRAVGVEEAFAKRVERGAALKDQVVAVMCPLRICARSWGGAALSLENSWGHHTDEAT
jgi:hypothetical protein